MNLQPRRRRSDRSPVLTFSPLAWLKLLFFCHHGNTEIGGFGITTPHDLLYIEEFRTVRQEVSIVTVRFDDMAVADLFDDCVDRGMKPEQFARIWLHTHPDASVTPSGVDEETFTRVFGSCDWSVMFILGRTGLTFARLTYWAGPRGSVTLPVQVDWSRWPALLKDGLLAAQIEQWKAEFAANIKAEPELTPLQPVMSATPRNQDLDWQDAMPWWWRPGDEITLTKEDQDAFFS
jgi:proteasome lid subunit RPN8/RPN11